MELNTEETSQTTLDEGELVTKRGGDFCCVVILNRFLIEFTEQLLYCNLYCYSNM